MSIHQEIVFTSNLLRVYKALTDTELFGEFSGAPAQIDPEPCGKFSCFGGMIVGQTIENMPAQRLVQAWRVANWEPGIYSVVKFEFEEVSDRETKIIFDHTGFPEEHRAHLEQGWHERYWKPLIKYLGS